jgi:TolA-binding protein
VIVESCDEAIGKENDHLKKEVKRLEFKVNKLKKQTKVQPPQDNHSNMVKKLEKGRTTPKIVSQQQSKQVHQKREQKNIVDENIEYVRSAYLNARMPHIKSGIGKRPHIKRPVTSTTQG